VKTKTKKKREETGVSMSNSIFWERMLGGCWEDVGRMVDVGGMVGGRTFG